MTAAPGLADRTAAELAHLLRSRMVSSREITEAALDRIEAVEPTLNCFITLMPEAALAQADAADAELADGRDRGPWHGMPVGLKDLLYTKGVRTTAGSAAMGDFVPTFDATVVTKLRDAGAVFLGKQNMHEFANGITNENLTFGASRNPWDPDHIPGGSSGGSAAAVAAGAGVAALGSDTGGSIRIPASCCGIVGLMPTYGRVSRHGVVPLSWSLDHVGPIARSVADAASLLEAIAGYDPRDGSSDPRSMPGLLDTEEPESLRGLRVAIPRNYFFDRVDAEVADAVGRAAGILTDLGATLVDVAVPHVELSPAVQYAVAIPEAFAWHRRLLVRAGDRYAPRIRLVLESGAAVSAADYLDAQRLRVLIRQGLVGALAKADVLLAPTIPVPPPSIGTQTVRAAWGEEDVLGCLLRLTCPVDLSGQPAISVPCGFSASGLPVGMQLIGRPFEERRLCRVAHAYERATPWHGERPVLTSGAFA